MITDPAGGQAAEKPSEAVPAQSGGDLPERIFEGRTWKSSRGDSNLVLEPTSEGDKDVVLWVGTPNDGPGAALAPAHMRELAYTLVQRADRVDPPERRWKDDVPRTPGELIASSLATGKAASERAWEESESPAVSLARVMLVIDSFTVAALMAELEQIAPERAAIVAQKLGDAYFDGGSPGEWLWQWVTDREEGKPIGFDPPATLPLGSVAAESGRG